MSYALQASASRGGIERLVIPEIEETAARAFGQPVNIGRVLKAVAAKAAFGPLERADLIQGGFLTVLNAARHFDAKHGAKPEHYVARALKNGATSARRLEFRHWRDRETETLPQEEGRSDEISSIADDDCADPEGTVIRAETIGSVQRFLGGLSDSLRQVFQLIYVEELPQRDVAARMCVSQARVSQLHSKLLALGKRHLTQINFA